MKQAVARVLRQAVEGGAVPGAVALVVDRGGVLAEAADGRRDLSADTPMSADTVFWIASMTKAITSVAAMQLVERGVLALDGPVGDVVRGMAEPSVIEGFDADGAPRLRPARGPITLRHLLTHTAGYGYPMWNREIGLYLSHTGLPRMPTRSEQISLMPLLFDPGTRWNYSIATDMLGLVVEAASGRRLAEYVKLQVLDPLDMSDTTYELSPAQRARLARVHQREADGSLRPIDWPAGEGQGFTGGGGGLCSTARDYGRFLRMLLNGGALDGARVLRPETVAEMGRNQIGELQVAPLITEMPSRSNNADLFPGMVQKWGLGFLINTAPGPSGRSPGSLAWAGLGNTYFWLDPQRGIAACVMTQILPFADPGALQTLAAVERAVYDN